MVRLGLISEQKTKTEGFFRRSYSKTVVDNQKNHFELIVVTVPFSQSQFKRLSERKKRLIVEKAVRILEQNRVKKVFLSVFLKENMNESEEPKKNKLRELFWFEKWAYLCIKGFAEKSGIKLLDANICISDSKMERISENLIRQLRYDTKCITIFTDNFRTAGSIKEQILDESGMHIRVFSGVPGNDADVIVDVDRRNVRFGRNLIIEQAVTDFETGGFETDLAEISAVLAELGIFDRNLLFFSGKNKLTL